MQVEGIHRLKGFMECCDPPCVAIHYVIHNNHLTNNIIQKVCLYYQKIYVGLHVNLGKFGKTKKNLTNETTPMGYCE